MMETAWLKPLFDGASLWLAKAAVHPLVWFVPSEFSTVTVNKGHRRLLKCTISGGLFRA